MMHSFLLIGQSNMAGRGFLHEAPPLPKENINVLRNGRWQPLYRPVNPDRPFSGVCLAERFAQRYAQTYSVPVGLIPCADGGTCMEWWMPGEALFDHAVAQARLAQRTSVIAGVLWHQGESDTFADRIPLYEERLKTMIQALRQALGLEGVPFLMGELGDFLGVCQRDDLTELKNYALINEALWHVASQMPDTAMVSAEGLTANADQLHFNAASLYTFGERYFDVYQGMGYTPPHRELGQEKTARMVVESL